jgi:NADH:ubiquinone oxidoreductase subunit 3 (subunit A)
MFYPEEIIALLVIVALVVGCIFFVAWAIDTDNKNEIKEQHRYEQCVKEGKDWVRQEGGVYVCVTKR